MLVKKIGFAMAFSAGLFLLMICALLAGVNAKEAVAVPSATTLDNLQTAYNGEMNAHTRYLAFARKADKEGYGAVASLFRAVALAEKVHYTRHAVLIKKLKGTPRAVIETPVVKSTKENLESAFAGETYEKDVMYPAFIKQAEKENDKEAIDAFEDAGAAEGAHAGLYAKMLKNLALSKGLTKEYYVCPVCGNVIDALNISLCPICSTPVKDFKKVR
jgi:rubrerythrin